MFDGVLAELFERCKQVSLSTDLTRQLATLELFVSSQPLAKVCDSVGVCVWGGGVHVVCMCVGVEWLDTCIHLLEEILIFMLRC